MRKTLTIICLAAATGGVVAACGSSSSNSSAGATTKAAGVVLAPSGGATAAAATPATSASSTTTASSSASSSTKLPTALSTEPTIKSPGGKPPTKLVTKDLIKGTGATVTSPSQTVTIAYVGALYSNSKVFDSSWKDVPSTHTISDPASGFVPGFQQGLLGMKVGGRRELIIPASLAYGSKAQKGIPANSALIFIIDLHAVS